MISIPALRLAHHQLNTRPFAHAEQVAHWLLALQAQDYAGALWVLGARMRDARMREIEQAVIDGRIVRTWPMRGTLHMMVATDVRWLLALLAPRRITQTAGRHRQLGLDADTFARSRKVLSAALNDGAQTRDALYAQFERAGVDPQNQRGYHLLVHAAQTGHICCGPVTEGQQTFVLLDAWVPAAPPKPRDEALAELARRYVLGHGPVTEADLVRWAGITATDARRALSGAGAAIKRACINEVDHWLSPDIDEAAETADTVHLLAAFDEYVLGYADRDTVLDPKHADAICPGGNGVFSPTVLVNGRIHGTWKRDRHTNSRAMFKPLPKRHAPLLAAATARYTQFSGAR